MTGGFHVTLVEIPPGSHKSWGSRVTAVGPRTKTDGLSEVQTIQLGSS